VLVLAGLTFGGAYFYQNQQLTPDLSQYKVVNATVLQALKNCNPHNKATFEKVRIRHHLNRHHHSSTNHCIRTLTVSYPAPNGQPIVSQGRVNRQYQVGERVETWVSLADPLAIVIKADEVGWRNPMIIVWCLGGIVLGGTLLWAFRSRG
jgi:hypothetical protein